MPTENLQVAVIVQKVREEEFINTEELEILRQNYEIPDKDIFYPPRVRRNPKIKIVGATLRRFQK